MESNYITNKGSKNVVCAREGGANTTPYFSATHFAKQNAKFAAAQKGFEPRLAVHSTEYTSLHPSIPNNSHSSANFNPSFVGLPAFVKTTDGQAGNFTNFIIMSRILNLARTHFERNC